MHLCEVTMKYGGLVVFILHDFAKIWGFRYVLTLGIGTLKIMASTGVFVKSSQVNTLPIAKSQTPSKQNRGIHKCSSVYSERGVLLSILTSGRDRVVVRACRNSIRVPRSLCNAIQSYDPTNPPPCACCARLRDVCSARPIKTVGPEPLHPHVCVPHIALEEGDHLMLFTIRRRSQVSLFLARVGTTCTLDRRVNE
jgi:hypothetical protein